MFNHSFARTVQAGVFLARKPGKKLIDSDWEKKSNKTLESQRKSNYNRSMQRLNIVKVNLKEKQTRIQQRKIKVNKEEEVK